MTTLKCTLTSETIQFEKKGGIFPSQLFAHLIAVLGHEEALSAFHQAFSLAIHNEFQLDENCDRAVPSHVSIADEGHGAKRERQLKTLLLVSGDLADLYHAYFPEGEKSALAKMEAISIAGHFERNKNGEI